MLKQLKKTKYKAVIIGAGQIGARADRPYDKKVLTYAHGFIKHPQTDLAGFFDINYEAAQRAAKKWGTEAFRNFDKMMNKVKPDIVSICTPDSTHFSILLKVAKYKPRVVICEKPVTTNLKDTEKIIKLFQRINVPVSTNYFRRLDKTIQKVQQDIRAKKYGKVLAASGVYTKGILHNGSHMIDLCRYLFGEVKKAKAMYALVDYTKEDKTIGGFLEFERCKQFYLIAGDERRFSIFELDIILEKGRLRLIHFNFCLSIQKVVNDPIYLQHRSLSKPTIKKLSSTKTMTTFIDNVIKHLEKKQPLICEIQDAFKTQQICEALLKQKSFL